MNDLALELVKVRILGKPYSKWRAILAETGESDTKFLMFLAKFGIAINKADDPMLYCAQDTQQMRLLLEDGVLNPTLCQIAMTSKAWSLTEQGCKDAWTTAMQTIDDDPKISQN